MLVAFESLTNCTPPICADRLERVLEPGEAFDRARHRRRRPRRRATPPPPPRPRRRSGGGRAAGSTTAARAAPGPPRCAGRSRRRPRAIPSPIESRHREQQPARARVAAAMASVAGSSALSTAQSSAVWFAKIRALAAAYSSTFCVTIEMVGREVQQHRDPRMKGVDGLELKAAGLDDVDRVIGGLVDLRAERAGRCCRRPARGGRPPPACGRSAWSSSTSPWCR